jgi:hypothetical protein
MLRTVSAGLRKSTIFRRLILVTALLFPQFPFAQTTKDGLDCLNLMPQEKPFSLSDHQAKCFRDELNFSNAKNVHDAEELLGISASEIRFVGCDIAPFYARVDRTEPRLHFEIVYNSTVDQSASMVAILHEIGHVYQLKRAGSQADLLSSAKQDLERVELGADYLAGLAIGRMKVSEKDLEVGLALVGSYEVHSGPHGLPHERSASFNFGVTSGKTETDIGSLYDTFQDEDYGNIKRRR